MRRSLSIPGLKLRQHWSNFLACAQPVPIPLEVRSIWHEKLKVHPLCLAAPCFCMHLCLWCWSGLLNNHKDIFTSRHLTWAGHFQNSPGLSSAQILPFQSMRHFPQPVFLVFIPAFCSNLLSESRQVSPSLRPSPVVLWEGTIPQSGASRDF